jgi:hypothetical protein
MAPAILPSFFFFCNNGGTKENKAFVFYILSTFLTPFYDDSVAYTVIWNAGYWIHALLDSEDVPSN